MSVSGFIIMIIFVIIVIVVSLTWCTTKEKMQSLWKSIKNLFLFIRAVIRDKWIIWRDKHKNKDA